MARITGVGYVFVWLLLAATLFAGERPPVVLTEEGKALHASSLVWDAHNDLPIQFFLRFDRDAARFNLREVQPKVRTDIPRLRQGGVKAQFWSCNPVDFPKIGFPNPYSATNAMIDIVYKFVELYPDTFEIARTASDVTRISQSGKIASLIGVEGGNALEGSMENLRHYYRRGARFMTLTHFATNDVADASSDKKIHGGLSEFGKQVVREMNDLGMIIDIAHVSVQTMRQVLKLSRKPVIFSHVGADGIRKSGRNIPDSIARMLPRNGGVVQVIFASRYLRSDGKEGTVHDFLDHVDHLVKIAGIDHVGLGSDFDGDWKYPKQLEDVSYYPYVTQGLLDRGYSSDDIRKILGGNLYRVMSQVSP